jgi:hypothetical protein
MKTNAQRFVGKSSSQKSEIISVEERRTVTIGVVVEQHQSLHSSFLTVNVRQSFVAALTLLAHSG